MDISYLKFCDLLKNSKERGLVTILHRGMTKDFAFEKLKLDVNLNTIEQFAEKLYFYGEKSKYFWNEKLNTSKYNYVFEINDISGDFFRYIFNEFNTLIKSHNHIGTTRFFEKNDSIISFFRELKNMAMF